MKSRAIFPALLVAGLIYLASASNAHAFGLLDRALGIQHHHHGCCGVVEPKCVAAPVCDPCACPDPCRPGLLQRLGERLRARACCDPCAKVCDPCPPACPVVVCPPACPDVCDPCAPRQGLLHRLFHRSACPCPPVCEPVCGH